MSKLTLITVQGTSSAKGSVADMSGLTEYLGYRPLFCTPVDPNSLAETWFRLWSTAPKYPETIYMFQIDEEDCIPVNVLGWVDLELNEDFTSEKFEVVKTNHYYPTDYIVKEIPENRIEITVKALLYSTEIYDYALGGTYEEKEAICNMFKLVQNSCIKTAEQMKTSNQKLSDDNILYDVLRNSGIISFLWQVATGNSVTSSLYTIEPSDFNSVPYNNAQNELNGWNENIKHNESFPYHYMHEEFIKALNIAAKNASMREAKRNKIGRNDLCSCGSGKKFKHCHAVKGMDELTMV